MSQEQKDFFDWNKYYVLWYVRDLFLKYAADRILKNICY